MISESSVIENVCRQTGKTGGFVLLERNTRSSFVGHALSAGTAYISHPLFITALSCPGWWMRKRVVSTAAPPYKAKRQFLLTLQVSRYCLLALQNTARQSSVIMTRATTDSIFWSCRHASLRQLTTHSNCQINHTIFLSRLGHTSSILICQILQGYI